MAPIESIGELLEIKLAEGESAPVKCAVNHRLGIANGGIDPPEHMRSLGIVTVRDCVVRVMGFGCGGVAGQAIDAPHPQGSTRRFNSSAMVSFLRSGTASGKASEGGPCHPD